MNSSRQLLAGVFVVAFMVAGCGAQDCLPWTDSLHSFSICLPNAWYHRTMPSGALFLCDDPRGRCVEPVGGGPSPGHATISVIPAREVVDATPKSLEGFAHAAADGDTSSLFSEVVTGTGRFAKVRYLVVSKKYSSGASDEIPQVVDSYFLEAGSQMVEVVLTHIAGDKRAQLYREKVMQIVLSFQPK